MVARMSNLPQAPIIRFELDPADARIAHVVIDNPTARNGLTAAACADMAQHIDNVSADPQIRALVVRGAGAHFCSGADLRSAGGALNDDDAVRAYLRDGFHKAIKAIAACPKPTLAVIRGACVGFGFDMALATDLRICASDATFGQVFTKIGLVPDGGSSFSLTQLVGLGKAMELMLLAERFDGAEAARIGLVNRVVDGAELDQLAADWARRLASGPPIAFRLGKQNLRAGAASGDIVAALQREEDAQLQCLRSRDALVGVQAFFLKQEPKFEGR